MIVCAGRNEVFNFAKTIGVGLIESAINLTKFCLNDKPEFILFIGSAGSYGKHNIFDIVESRKASNVELSFLRDDSYTPLNSIIESENNITRNDVVVNSSNYISKNFDLTNKYDSYNIDCENMEFYSVLQVANEFNIPAAGIFVITNYTNENAHKDFLSNHKEAMDRLIEYVKKNKYKTKCFT